MVNNGMWQNVELVQCSTTDYRYVVIWCKVVENKPLVHPSVYVVLGV